MNVVALKAKPTIKVARKPSRKAVKAIRRQALAGVAVGSIAIVLVGLSLNHLAHGIEIVTNSPTWEAYSMAIGIDLGFMSAEVAQLFAGNDKLRKLVNRFAKPAIVGTMLGSAAMNAFAFASGAIGYMVAPAVVLGIAIPGLIYALTRIGVALYIDCSSK